MKRIKEWMRSPSSRRGHEEMDLRVIIEAMNKGDIPLIYKFIQNPTAVQKFLEDDPRVFQKILLSAIVIPRFKLKHIHNVNEICDDLTLQLIKAAKKVHFDLIDEKTVLIWALNKRMSYNIIFELIRAGSDVNAVLEYSMTPLLIAINAKNSQKVVAELIKQGSKVNCRDYKGYSPLFYGMLYHFYLPDFIKMLLEAGSNVQHLDDEGRNILMIENCHCLKGRNCTAKESINLLFKYDINDKDFKHIDNKGNTVLHKTLCKYVFELALKCGVSIETKNNDGRTPLLANLETISEQRLIYMLKSGADVNSTDLNLQTALHLCVLKIGKLKDPNIIDTLIYYGGNIYTRNIYGKTPLDIIIEQNFLNELYSFVIPKHIILFDDNGFDIGNDVMENLFDGESVSSYIDLCKKELKVMRETFIKDGLTVYDFCVLRRYYKNKWVNISPVEYKYTCSQINELFPIYKRVINIRVKDNYLRKRDLSFHKTFESIVFSPIHSTEMDFDIVLNCYCLYNISRHLKYEDMYNTFIAAIQN